MSAPPTPAGVPDCRPLAVSAVDVHVDLPGHGVGALAGVTLALRPAEQVAVLGPSGAGKTTLVRALLGAVPLAGGRITVGPFDPAAGRSELRALRRRVGLVRQGGDLVPALSVRANVLAGVSHDLGAAGWWLLSRGRVPEHQAERLIALAAQHGLDGLLDVPTERLSGGQRQRVALLRALIGSPGLLLADEPTAGLDPGTAARAVAALRSARVTLLVTTHDLGVARGFDRVVALADGRVAWDGPGFDDVAADALYGARA